jgi:nicotinamide-nucleotide amidase
LDSKNIQQKLGLKDLDSKSVYSYASRVEGAKTMIAEIIAVGSKMLTPFRQDTNSLFITEKLNELGVAVHFKSIVGDRIKELVAAVRTGLRRADILVVIGGLGPTEDDLTREAVAEALSLALHRDSALEDGLRQRAAERNYPLPANNLKQADLIQGATVLPNANGTAAGQWLDATYFSYRKLVLLVPGPPNECKPLFESECMPRLKALLPARHIAKRTLRAAMIAESQVDDLLAPIYKQYSDVETTILAHAGDIQLTLLCGKTTEEAAQKRVDDLAGQMEEVLEDWLYSTGGESLEQIVLYFLELRQATLAVAESCTGGMISQRITSVPGASRCFLGGAIVYWDELKTSFSDVPPEVIAQYGAVSQPVARALAKGIRQRTGATIGVGVTGIAGPGGGSGNKPVGLVHIAVADAHNSDAIDCTFHGDRERIREFATQQALDLVRRKLM